MCDQQSLMRLQRINLSSLDCYFRLQEESCIDDFSHNIKLLQFDA